jgi:hypothetical protein
MVLMLVMIAYCRQICNSRMYDLELGPPMQFHTLSLKVTLLGALVLAIVFGGGTIVLVSLVSATIDRQTIARSNGISVHEPPERADIGFTTTICRSYTPPINSNRCEDPTAVSVDRSLPSLAFRHPELPDRGHDKWDVLVPRAEKFLGFGSLARRSEHRTA